MKWGLAKSVVGILTVALLRVQAAVPDRSTLDQTAYEQASRLVASMTLDEKINLIEMNNKAIDRLNIPAHHWWSEALHGVARRGKATQFPVPLCMASTWNETLIQTMADAISTEARALHHADSPKEKTEKYHGLTIWSPTINMARDPRWGRTEETYGEDPFLTGQLGIAFVKGLQGDHPDFLKTVATVKHFAANNTEHNRRKVSPAISERALREYYLPAFRVAVEEADAESIMSAYNGINGIPCSANRWLLTDVLRGEWGFNGTVVTDAGAAKWMFLEHRFTSDGISAIAAMVKAGVDVCCGAESKWAKQAIEAGMLSEKELDRSITQSLASRIKLGLLRPESENPYTTIPLDTVGCEKHLEIARQIAREGIVLLKNEQNVLPASPKKYDRIVLAGPYANVAPLGGYSGTPTHPSVTPADGFKQLAGASYEVANRFGGQWVPVPEACLNVPDDQTTRGLKADYFQGPTLEGAPKATRVDPMINFVWPLPFSHIDPLIPEPDFSVRWTGQLTPNRSGEHIFSIEAENGARVFLNGKKILDIWGQMAEETQISKPVFLKAGKPVDLKVEYFNAEKANSAIEEIRVGLKWMEPTEKPGKSNPEKDLLVYVGGIAHEMAHESRDLMDLRFPEDQLQEIAELAKEYPNMVVVVNTGTAVQLDQVKKLVPALLIQWFPGQEGGTALAEVITGAVNPSGRLPLSIYTDASQLPDFEDYELQKGRTYQYASDNITYPFGYGIGYAPFEYDAFQAALNGDRIDVSVQVKNTGTVDGDDVVQIYVTNLDSGVYQPIRQLKAFRRVHVPASGTARAELTVPVQSLEWWSTDKQKFTVNSGRYKIQAGRSSADVCAEQIITIPLQ